MVTFKTISKSTSRLMKHVPGKKSPMRRQQLAVLALLGRRLRGDERVYWFSEHQPVICSYEYAGYLLRMQYQRAGSAKRYLGTGKRDGYKREHVVVAERSLGKPLPAGAEVHHVDGDKWNNAPSNLVICNDHGYHVLLHVRTRVVRAGGNPNSERICTDCKLLRPMARFARNSNQCYECKTLRNRERREHRRAHTVLP